MKCKKCNANNNKNEKFCKKCGARLNSLNPIIFIVALGLIIFFVYINKNSPIVPVTPINPVNNNNINNNVPALIESNENVKELAKKGRQILKDYEEFYETYKDYSAFITKNGIIFDYNENKYVDINYFYKENELAKENVLLMLLKSQDLKDIIDINTEPLFSRAVIYKLKDSYLFIANNKTKEISLEEYQTFIEKYKTSNSRVSGLSSLKETEDGKKIIKEITTLIKEHENDDKEIALRVLSVDDKFAMAIYSALDDGNKLKQSIILKKDSKWVMALDNIEEELKPALYINSNLVNFNLEMLPKYTLRQYKDIMKDDYSSLLEGIKQEEYVKEDDEVTFYSGTQEYVYFEFKSGTKLIGSLNQDRMWVIYPIKSYEEAAIMMLSTKETAPIFILKQ